MKTKATLKMIPVLLFFLSSQNIFSQVAVSNYSIYSAGISTDNNKKISGELKLFLNTEYEDIGLEPTVFFNFPQKEFYQFSIGLGVNTSAFEDSDIVNVITVPFQLEVNPLTDVKNLSILTELAPQIGENAGVRLLWGIRYTFRKN
jgi:hypothetical protein